MTPLTQAREAQAAVEKALSDNVAVISTSQVGGSAICGATTEVNGKIAVDCVAEVYGLERAAAIVAAVNFTRDHLPALIDRAAEAERLAERVAKLEGALRGLLPDFLGGIDPMEAEPVIIARALLTPAEGADDGR